jgi:hypothetical protein
MVFLKHGVILLGKTLPVQLPFRYVYFEEETDVLDMTPPSRADTYKQ